MGRKRKERKCMNCRGKEAVVTKTVRGYAEYHTIRPKRLIQKRIKNRYEYYTLCLDCLYKDDLVHSVYCMGITFEEFKERVEMLLDINPRSTPNE